MWHVCGDTRLCNQLRDQELMLQRMIIRLAWAAERFTAEAITDWQGSAHGVYLTAADRLRTELSLASNHLQSALKQTRFALAAAEPTCLPT